MEELQKELVRLCNGYPEGLHLREVHGLYQRTYGKPLGHGTAKRLAPLQTLLRSVPDHLHLCANGAMVVWPVASRPSSSSAPSAADSLPSTPAARLAKVSRDPRLASPRVVSASAKGRAVLHQKSYVMGTQQAPHRAV
ncbi:hypothetical protein NHX12_025370 [Muraenolepis orangiensis]|uniref:HTH OST-type domain-containing protein n=1 Tax=Muraenolepis orangiensis TaxID=630683 RepID=A0A9Q0ITA5_9TELE|nr:hypothetical protein NHX12_025370 [Muraenolepis orangiensis]